MPCISSVSILYFSVSICALAIPICLDFIIFIIKLITISKLIMYIDGNLLKFITHFIHILKDQIH